MARFELEPRRTALVIVDMQYYNCRRDYGYGRKLRERGERDVEEHFFDPKALLYRYERIERVVLPNLRRVLEFFRENGLKVVYTATWSERPDYSDIPEHLRPLMQWAGLTKGSRECEILDEIKPREGEYVVRKTTYSAFASSNIDSLLQAIGAKYLLFGGVTTDICVGSTAREAAERGYHCVMIDDCCATLSDDLQRVWMKTFDAWFGQASSTDEVLRGLELRLQLQARTT